MDVINQWMPQSNGCHKAMDVTKQWMPQRNGCHKAMDVTKQCMSQSSGCHKAMDVIEQWMSRSNGCHKSNGCHTAMDVTRAMVVTELEQWMSWHESFVFTSSTLRFLGREVSHKSFASTSSAFTLFEGSLARKRRFQFNV